MISTAATKNTLSAWAPLHMEYATACTDQPEGVQLPGGMLERLHQCVDAAQHMATELPAMHSGCARQQMQHAVHKCCMIVLRCCLEGHWTSIRVHGVVIWL